MSLSRLTSKAGYRPEPGKKPATEGYQPKGPTPSRITPPPPPLPPRPFALTDLDIRYRRVMDDCRDLAQAAIGAGRAAQAAALLEAERNLARARVVAEAHRAGKPHHKPDR
jgi:hypothetical protein